VLVIVIGCSLVAKRSASNRPALKTQVRRWQDAASVAWSDSDILDVSRYPKETIYRLE